MADESHGNDQPLQKQCEPDEVDSVASHVPEASEEHSNVEAGEPINNFEPRFVAATGEDSLKNAEISKSVENGKPNDAVDAGPIGKGPEAEKAEGSEQETSKAVLSHISTDGFYRYKMDHPKRGHFVIFNQVSFDAYNKGKPKDEQLNKRPGSKHDATRLKEIAEKLGFEYVKVHTDSTKDFILKHLDELSRADHADCDCFACAILTHGGDSSEGEILYAHDEEMKLTDFTDPFRAHKCEMLATKPKLFFIQACRGTLLDPGSEVCTDSVDGPPPTGDVVDGPVIEKKVSIPVEADFLIANATVPKYFAWNNPDRGSYFIRFLCDVFNSHFEKMEIMQMMTRVNRKVAYEFESGSNSRDFDKKKQIPSIATRLTAELYFTPKQKQEEGKST